jgi:Flp pilus assembly protein TadD
VGLGQYLAAEEVLAEAVKGSPKDLTLHLALVRFYTDHTFRVADRGLAAARAAAAVAPDDPQVRDLLGWMYFLAGDLKQAHLHLASALRLDPELVSAIYHLGMLHRALGEEEAARFAFLRVVDLDTDGFYRDRAQIALRELETPAQ